MLILKNRFQKVIIPQSDLAVVNYSFLFVLSEFFLNNKKNVQRKEVSLRDRELNELSCESSQHGPA